MNIFSQIRGIPMKTYSLLMFTFISCQLMAQPVPDSPPKEHELQLGLAAVSSQSVYIGGKTQTQVFPAIDYQYQRFYFQAGELGFNLIENKTWEVNAGLNVNLVGDTDRGDSRLLKDLPELSLPLSSFVSATYISKVGLFKLKHDVEINNKHNGQSSALTYSAPIFKGKWLIMPQLSVEHHSEEVVHYFYGINPLDATLELPSYRGESATNYTLSVLAIREFNDRWSWVGSVQNEFLADEITDSPMVDEDQRLSVFAGLLYKFF